MKWPLASSAYCLPLHFVLESMYRNNKNCDIKWQWLKICNETSHVFITQKNVYRPERSIVLDFGLLAKKNLSQAASKEAP